MKPRETEDEGMQRADTQIPVRSSPPASEAQPDHCRKDVQKVGSQRHSQCTQSASIAKVFPVHAVSVQEELGRKEHHMEERKREEERVVQQPRRSSEEERRGG